MGLQRKHFLVVLASGGWLVACGGGGGDGDDDGQAAGCGTGFSANHGHTLSIPAADLDSASTRNYTTGGFADHVHSVMLSTVHLAALKAGQPVTVQTTGGPGHEHDVSISCV